MKTEERDPAVLQTILTLIERIKVRLAKTTLAQFVEDDDDMDLRAFRLSMIGEYAQKLSATLRERHPGIPWKLMIGLRNIVVHEYRRVTPGRIWETAHHDLDALESLCRSELKALES